MKTEKQAPTKRPIKVAGYSHAKADARAERRRKEADLRQGRYDALSILNREARDARLKQRYDDRLKHDLI